MNGRPMAAVGQVAVAGFFVIHYGLFWFVHGIFVLTLPLFAGLGNGVATSAFPRRSARFDGSGSMRAWPLAVVALARSATAVSYWFNYLGGGEYRRTRRRRRCSRPTAGSWSCTSRSSWVAWPSP